MKLWVDVIRFVKRGAAGGALSFFTYMELSECTTSFYQWFPPQNRCIIAIWLVLFHLFRPDRLKW